jgi:AcrR family transcriptional regulator
MTAQMTRRERERLRHRREILAVAKDVFSQKGFDQTTMAEIAERAEFAVGTLYRFFKDKEALYDAIILDVIQQAEQALCAALATPGDEVERLGRFIEVKVHLFFEHVATARFYFAHAVGARLSLQMTAENKIRRLCDKISAHVEDVFRSAIRKKIIVGMDPHALALGLNGLSDAFLPEVLERPSAYSEREIVSIIKKMFFGRVSLRPED